MAGFDLSRRTRVQTYRRGRTDTEAPTAVQETPHPGTRQHPRTHADEGATFPPEAPKLMRKVKVLWSTPHQHQDFLSSQTHAFFFFFSQCWILNPGLLYL